MIDSETKSLWSHLLGEAMEGELKGKILTMHPSHMTNWASWKREHPDTTVVKLSRTSQNYRTEFYRNPSQFVVGIARGGQATAWSFQQLMKTPVINDQFASQLLVVVFDSESKTALTFSRQLGERVLHFAENDQGMVDRETGSIWNRLTGKAIDGPLEGKYLRPVASIVGYTKAWVTFHPKTTGLTKEQLERAQNSRRRRPNTGDNSGGKR